MKHRANVALPITRLMFVPAVAAVSIVGIGVLGMTSPAWIPVTVGVVLALTFGAERIAPRLYGLNGLMKHPVHLLFETAVGMAPLIVMGIDSSTAAALAGLVAVQLVLQHANVDYRVGRLGRWFAWNAGHRLHHVADEIEGNVNFGLFTLTWDRLLGTYREPALTVPPPIVGLAGRVVPARYREQLAMPWDAPRRA